MRVEKITPLSMIPLNQGRLTFKANGPGPVTRALVQARTRELTLSAGRHPLQVSQEDYERAKRELTGESDLDRQNAVLDALPEERRGAPVPRSPGQWAPESSPDAEDAEGRREGGLRFDEASVKAARDLPRPADLTAVESGRAEPPGTPKS